jgi:hypothetical protein
MTLYRIDRYEINEHDPGQQIGYTDWIGGPTLANVKGAILTGTNMRRAARITGEPLTYFSYPAVVTLNGVKVRGWLGCDDGIYVFHPYIN